LGVCACELAQTNKSAAPAKRGAVHEASRCGSGVGLCINSWVMDGRGLLQALYRAGYSASVGAGWALGLARHVRGRGRKDWVACRNYFLWCQWVDQCRRSKKINGRVVQKSPKPSFFVSDPKNLRKILFQSFRLSRLF